MKKEVLEQIIERNFNYETKRDTEDGPIEVKDILLIYTNEIEGLGMNGVRQKCYKVLFPKHICVSDDFIMLNEYDYDKSLYKEKYKCSFNKDIFIPYENIVRVEIVGEYGYEKE